jgi:copper(I)-binding protein
MSRTVARVFLSLALAAMAAPVLAQVQVSDAWARATVVGQKGTGAFMKLTAPEGATLVGAVSPVAGVVEIHEMAMEGTVMRMRALPKGLALPAGKAVELKPGGHHVMLMDLKQQLKAGEKVKLDLQFELRDKKRVTQPLEIEVRSVPPMSGMPPH